MPAFQAGAHSCGRKLSGGRTWAFMVGMNSMDRYSRSSMMSASFSSRQASTCSVLAMPRPSTCQSASALRDWAGRRQTYAVLHQLQGELLGEFAGALSGGVRVGSSYPERSGPAGLQMVDLLVCRWVWSADGGPAGLQMVDLLVCRWVWSADGGPAGLRVMDLLICRWVWSADGGPAGLKMMDLLVCRWVWSADGGPAGLQMVPGTAGCSTHNALMCTPMVTLCVRQSSDVHACGDPHTLW